MNPRHKVEVIDGETFYTLSKYPDIQFSFKNIEINENASDGEFIRYQLNMNEPVHLTEEEETAFFNKVEEFLYSLIEDAVKNQKQFLKDVLKKS